MKLKNRKHLRILHFALLVLSFALVFTVFPAAPAFAEDETKDTIKILYGDHFTYTDSNSAEWLCYEAVIQKDGEESFDAVIYGCNNARPDLVIPSTVKDSNGNNLTVVGVMPLDDIQDSLIFDSFFSYRGSYDLGEIHFPDSVYFIGDEVFSDSDFNLVSKIELPDNEDLRIGANAFAYCGTDNALGTTVTFGDKPVTIGERAFYKCEGIKSLTLPVGSNIDETAFEGCVNIKEINNAPAALRMGEGDHKLESVVFDPTLTYIYGLNAIKKVDIGDDMTEDVEVGFPHLTTVTLPENCSEIGSAYFGCFYGCSNLTTINNLDWGKITYIGDKAFYGCSNLITPSTLDCSRITEIGFQAFYGCRQIKLENVKWPQDYNLYSDYFSGSGLVSITLPGNLDMEYLGMHGKEFRGCYDLTAINVEPNTEPSDTEFFSVDGVLYLYSYDRVCLVKYPANKNPGGSFTIPSNVHTISGNAFEGCKLAELHIPSSVQDVWILEPDDYGFEGLDPFENASPSLTIYMATTLANEHEYVNLLEHYNNVKREPGYEDLFPYDDPSDDSGSSTQNPPVNPGTAVTAHQHTYTDWMVTTPATEIASGEQTRTCSVCGAQEKQEIAQLAPTLPAVKIAKPKAAKKAAAIKWKKLSKKNLKKVAKIEIQYSTSKNFSSNVKTKYASAKKTSYTIKKLKSKKTYYVRIRAYRKSGGAVHVSKWSAVKKVKAK